jgi:hypothetical protein
LLEPEDVSSPRDARSSAESKSELGTGAVTRVSSGAGIRLAWGAMTSSRRGSGTLGGALGMGGERMSRFAQDQRDYYANKP